MSKVDSWTAAYEDFLACSDRLTEELDRFSTQMQDSKIILDRVGKYTEHVDATSRRISYQVEEAEKAWSNSDEIAARAAKQAYSAAFEGVRSSMQAVTESLGRSVQANEKAAFRVNQVFAQYRNYLIYIGSAFVLCSSLASSCAVYLASVHSSNIESETKQNARFFEIIWNNANKKEQAKLEEILNRAGE